MTLTAADAVAWMARLAGLATTVAALELICVRRALGERGVFRWAILRRDYAGAPRGRSARSPTRCSARAARRSSSACSSRARPRCPGSRTPAVAWCAVATTLAIAVRFRGSYNGGSDAMLLVVLIGVALARTGPGTALERAGLAYAAVQLVLSYFVSGVAKLGDRRWRDGTALPLLVALPQYAVRRGHSRRSWRGPSSRARPAAAMLAFECAFPLALVRPTACAVLLAIGLGFHAVNAVAFGLNRFLWAWLAAYPALVFWVLELR